MSHWARLVRLLFCDKSCTFVICLNLLFFIKERKFNKNNSHCSAIICFNFHKSKQEIKIWIFYWKYCTPVKICSKAITLKSYLVIHPVNLPTTVIGHNVNTLPDPSDSFSLTGQLLSHIVVQFLFVSIWTKIGKKPSVCSTKEQKMKYCHGEKIKQIMFSIYWFNYSQIHLALFR